MKPLRLLGIDESSGRTLAFHEPHGKDSEGLRCCINDSCFGSSDFGDCGSC